MKIAVVGGTGSFGKPLARRLVEAGDDVVVGSRDAGRAAEAAEEIGARGAENASAVEGVDLVILAVAADAALETARSLASRLSAPLLSVASELEFAAGSARPVAGGRSLAERIAGAVDVPVVAGLHSIAARNLAAGELPEEDAFVCGDDEEAKELALDVAAKLVAGRAVDAGPLAVARALEGLTAVIVNLNRRYKGHAGVRVTGLP